MRPKLRSTPATLLLVAAALAPACSPPSAPPGTDPAAEGVVDRAAPAAPAPAPASELASPRTLAPGDELERRIGGGETHRYRVVVPAGSTAVVEIEQLGADVEARLHGPGGDELLVDSPAGNRGREEVWVRSEAGGAQSLDVRLWPGAAPGRYALRVGVPRPLAPRDLRWRRACELYPGAWKLHDAGRYEESAQLLLRVAAEFDAAGAPGQAGKPLYSAARIHLENLDRPRAAARLFGRAAERFEEAGEARWLGLTLNYASQVERELENLGRAEELVRRAIAALSAVPDLDGVAGALARAHNDLGRVHTIRGETELALAAYERALELQERPGAEGLSAARLVTTLTGLGTTLQRSGDTKGARHYLRRALEVRPGPEAAPGDRSAVTVARAHARTRLCRLHHQEDELERAARCAARVLEELGAAGVGAGATSRAPALVFQGQIAAERGDVATALAALAEAGRIYRRAERRSALAVVLNSRGWLEVERERPAAALEPFAEALALAREGGDGPTEANTLLGIAHARRELGELAAALAAVERSIALVEELRREPLGFRLRAHFLASRHDHYAVRVDLMMRLHERRPGEGWDRRALGACERARARALLETLERIGPGGGEEADAGHGAAAAAGEGGGTARRERELAVRLRALEEQHSELVWSGAESHRLDELRRAMEHHELALERLRSRLRPPAEQVSLLGADEIQEQVVDPGSLLLSYHLGEERSYLWVVGPHSLTSHLLPPGREIEAAARRAHELTSVSRLRPARAPARHALEELAELVLAPAAPSLGDGLRLLVAAEGALLYAPFAALPLPADGRPLVAAHEVVTLPSASTLGALRRRLAGREPAPGVLAVLADPVFQPSDPRVRGYRGEWRSALERSGASLERLPFSGREARSILALAPPGATFFEDGFDADRDLVLSGALSGYRIVHLATHALISSRHPADSALVLSRLDRRGRRRPGRLRMRQIYRLDLPAELVVLSACRTALGEEVRGEGLVGFTQGFLSAGAARVLVSLWEVGDESTAVLMERFYRGLFQDGLAPAAALRRAQSSMASEDTWRAPYHWAGFVLQGEPR